MPYYGDQIKKEREALDLIIKMKRKEKNSHVGEIVFFVIFPLVMAVCVMKYKDIKDYAAHNEQISAVIKMVYPAWKSADELAPPALPEGMDPTLETGVPAPAEASGDATGATGEAPTGTAGESGESAGEGVPGGTGEGVAPEGLESGRPRGSLLE